jgi:hypothetical protein
MRKSGPGLRFVNALSTIHSLEITKGSLREQKSGAMPKGPRGEKHLADVIGVSS